MSPGLCLLQAPGEENCSLPGATLHLWAPFLLHACHEPAGRAYPGFCPQAPSWPWNSPSSLLDLLGSTEMLTFVLCCPLLLSNNPMLQQTCWTRFLLHTLLTGSQTALKRKQLGTGTSASEKGCTKQTPGCFPGRKQQERHFLGTEAMAHQPHIQHRACGAGGAASPRSTSASLLVLAGVCWLGGFRT